MKIVKNLCLFLIILSIFTVTYPGDAYALAEENKTAISITKPEISSLTLEVGDTYQVKAKVLNGNSNNKLIYKSDNTKVAAVTKKGIIKAVKKGKATITVSIDKKPNISKKISVTVKAPGSGTDSSKETEIQFKFYSSVYKDVYLAGDMNNWSETGIKMKKNGNWFTVSLPVNGNTEYKFIADGTWLTDPFSIDTKGEYANAILDLGVNKKTNLDCDIYTFSSEHFDYFSLKDEDKTDDLENLYTTLETRLLAFMNPEIRQDKIRYYGIDYTSDLADSWFNVDLPFSIYDTSEVFDLWDCNSSHELIHLMVSVQNAFFNEGLAQCFQYEGNMSYKEQNVNLIMSDQIKTSGKTDFMNVMADSIQTAPADYCMPASFLFYNTQVLDNDKKIAAFLKSLTYDDSLQDIQDKYQTATGKSMTSVVADWEEWLKKINSDSDIYIQW